MPLPASRQSSSRRSPALHLIDVCHNLYSRGYVTATDGNVSVRLKNGNILTTRSMLNKGETTATDLVEVDLEGRVVRGKGVPSTEVKMHLLIYRSRPDAGGVVHAHPTYATGFAAAGQPIPGDILPEVAMTFGEIPVAPYATPSTDKLASSLRPYLDRSPAILLQNHGVVTFGRDLTEAYYRMEKVEHAAHIIYVARMLGGEKPLPAGEVKKLQALLKTRSR